MHPQDVKMPSTLSKVNKDRSKSIDDLVASGAVVELRYQDSKSAMSLRAAKLLHLLVKNTGEYLCEHKNHEIQISEINKNFHISYAELLDDGKELVSTLVEMTVKREHIHTMAGPILDHIDVAKHDSGMFLYRFSETMVNVFKLDDRWTILNKSIVMDFDSRYALRLFEILSLRRQLSRKYEIFEIKDLRLRLGVEKRKLESFSHFRQKCLDPAINEVSKATGMVVSYTTLKRGNAVTAIELTWTDPIAAVLAPTHAKPDKPAPQTPSKAPQAAKSKPLAITIANDQTSPSLTFPAKGEARAIEPWASLMRDLAPSYKIAGALESGFRTAMTQEGTALDAPDIQERFRTYVAERYKMFCETRPDAKPPTKRNEACPASIS